MGYISFIKYICSGINNLCRNLAAGSFRRLFCIDLSCGGIFMLVSKCKNSVFCAKFLLFFLVGTICGTWLFGCLNAADFVYWELFGTLSGKNAGWSLMLSVLRPLVIAGLACVHPYGYAVLSALVVARGLLMSYAFCAVLHAGVSPCPLVLRGVVLLPIFYGLCRFAYDHRRIENNFLRN